jgi:hypothetical protein
MIGIGANCNVEGFLDEAVVAQADDPAIAA